MTAKLKALWPEGIAEIEDFIVFLKRYDTGRQLACAATKLTEPNLQRVGTAREMLSMRPFEYGDIVLLLFPFADLLPSTGASIGREADLVITVATSSLSEIINRRG